MGCTSPWSLKLTLPLSLRCKATCAIRHWSVWAPAARHRQVGDILALSDDCPPLGILGITRCAVDERVAVPAGTRVRVTASTAELIYPAFPAQAWTTSSSLDIVSSDYCINNQVGAF